VFLDVRSAHEVESSWGVGTSEARIFECPTSGLRFRRPLAAADIAAMYGAEYHDRMVGHEDPHRTLAYRAENAERIRFLRRFCASGSALDVGCSTGLFASQLRDAGFDVIGLDISEYACRVAAGVLGEDHVRCGDLASVAGELENALDAVTMMDVIEHVDDIVATLKAVHSVLKSGGILFVRTPTLSSPFFRVADLSYRLTRGLYKKAVLQIYHAEHFYFFNEQSITELLEQVGFDVLRIEPDPLLWENFRSAELRHGALVNAVLAGVYFLGRAVGRGHGMRVVARRRARGS